MVVFFTSLVSMSSTISFQIYTKTFKCTYQLQMYPFDTQVASSQNKAFPQFSQVCSVLLKVRKLETAAMVLNPMAVDMESETMLTQYIIRKWSVAATLDHN